MNYKIIKVLILGGFFERIMSHWCYETEHFKIYQRIYTDDPNFDSKILAALIEGDLLAICYLGKDAAVNAHYVDHLVFKSCDSTLTKKYLKLVKIVRIQNTNLINDIEYKSEKDAFLKLGDKSSGASWLRVALEYNFDIIFTQTYGNAEIINNLTNRDTAIFLPYAYNDKRFYPRNQKKNIDIGMYFKIERHSNRIRFIDHIVQLIYKNGWKFCICNAYWGDEYAEHIGDAKIVLHYSYIGDIPYRLYEAAGSRACFLTDTLGFGIERFFEKNVHYFEFEKNLDNLERKIDWILNNSEKRAEVEEAAYRRVKDNYTWSIVAERIVVPSICDAASKKRGRLIDGKF